MQGTRETWTGLRAGAGKNEGWRYKNITGPRIAIITIFSSLTMHLGAMNSVGQRLPINAVTLRILEPRPPSWRKRMAAFLSRRALASWRLCVFALKLEHRDALTARREEAHFSQRQSWPPARKSLLRKCWCCIFVANFVEALVEKCPIRQRLRQRLPTKFSAPLPFATAFN